MKTDGDTENKEPTWNLSLSLVRETEGGREERKTVRAKILVTGL